MVPIRNAKGESVELPRSILNRRGYDHEFDREGRLDEYRIGFAAMAEHLYQLDRAAERHGAGIWRVIFDPDLQGFLRQTPRWRYLSESVQFSARPSHDQHYHVDFEVPCEATG